MKKAIFLILFFVTITPVFAQKDLYNRQTLKRLQAQANDLKTQEDLHHSKAMTWAKANGWDSYIKQKDGSVWTLQRLNALGEPIYYKTHSNFAAGQTTRTNSIYDGGSLGLKLNGNSTFMVGKLGIWDGGAVLRTHQEFGSRVTQLDNASTTDAHATHTSGTLVAGGINAIARGMSFGANLSAYDFNNDTSEMTAASSNLLLSNHSYGAISGWNFSSTRSRWEWWGNDKMSLTEDYKFGFYEESCAAWDKIAYNTPYYLIVQSAGNERNTIGPAEGTWYFLGSSTRDSSKAVRNQSLTYDLVDTHGNAKNTLTVGAITTFPTGALTPSDIRMSSFSSWGPTDDGRIKPDLVGVGVSVVSTFNTSNTAYGSLSGTSMSSPQVTGSLFLLQELYASQNDKQFMRSATLKALALHTTDEAGRNPGPDYEFGWGLLNIERAGNVLLNKTKSNLLVEKQLAQGETFSQSFIANGKSPLTFTIAWTDPEAVVTTLVKENLNSRVPKLVNDLDIRVSDGTGNFLPWILDPDQPANAATKGDNIRDNVEQISIPDAVPGKTYTLTVAHKGTLQRSPQAYSLVASGIGGSAYCASNASDKADSKIVSVNFGNIKNTSKTDCSAYTDLTNLSTSVAVGQQIPLEITLGTCGANIDKLAKVFIDWNSDADFDDANELVATSAIINATGSLKTNVSIPSGLVVGASGRMRVVCAETSDPTKVNNCGVYAKGETQEFLIKFVRPAKDLAVMALLNPEVNFCGGIALSQAIVTIRNEGTTALTNIPVKLRINDASGQVASFEGLYSKILTTLSEDKITLRGNFDPKAGIDYTFTISAELDGDQDPNTNTLVIKRGTAATNAAPKAIAFNCEDELNLSGEGNGTLYWYDAPTNGKLLGIGNTVIQPKPTISTVYAGLNDFSGIVGAASKTVFPTGGYNQFSPAVRISTQVPVILESARLYIGNAGKVIFSVQRESDGVEVSSVTLDVKATRSPAAVGASDDDAKDPGQVYALGLSVPSAGIYQIAVSFEDGATIFRNRDNIKGYPFTIPGVMSIIGNTASAPSDPLQFYYYFYDLKVKANGCTSPTRTAVKINTGNVSTATISPNTNTSICAGTSLMLTASTGMSYQWRKDTKEIALANKSTFEVKEAGQYSVVVKELEKCPSISQTIGIISKPLPLRPDISKTDNVLATTSTNTLQWFFNSLAITGATSKTLTAGQTGRYYVQNTVDGCSAISDELTIIITAAEAQLSTRPMGLEVFPNPSAGDMLVIKYRNNNAQNKANCIIFDALGRPIKSQAMIYEDQQWTLKTSLADMPTGMLLVSVSDQQNTVTRKLIKR